MLMHIQAEIIGIHVLRLKERFGFQLARKFRYHFLDQTAEKLRSFFVVLRSVWVLFLEDRERVGGYRVATFGDQFLSEESKEETRLHPFLWWFWRQHTECFKI